MRYCIDEVYSSSSSSSSPFISLPFFLLSSGTLWVTYNHICFYSSILMFKKKEVIPFSTVVAAWKEDGRITNGIGLFVDGEQLQVSIPVQRDRERHVQ